MRVLVVSTTAWPAIDGKIAGDFLMVVRPGEALFGHRFDLIVGPATLEGHEQTWWDESVLCRLEPDGRIVRT